MPTTTTDQGLSLPVGPDAANNPTAFSNFVAGVEPRLVRLYTDAADRTAKMLVVAENELSGLGTENRVEVYDGANHVSLYRRAVYTYSRVTTDQLLTISNTTLQNLTNLVVTLPANGSIVAFRAVLFYDTSTTADLKVAFTIPAGTTMKWAFSQGPATGLAGTTGDGLFGVQTGSGTALAIGGAGVGTPLMACIEGELTVGATPGDLQMQAAQNTSDATQSTIQTRSRIEAWRSS